MKMTRRLLAAARALVRSTGVAWPECGEEN